MNNKGQTTVLFSLMIGVLLLFTLTAMEVGRIYMSRVKARACVHSARTSIMADYDRELFERYHLLFLDPTYGTGSQAVAEEKFKQYLEASLNGETTGKSLYRYEVLETAIADQKGILDNRMELFRQQVVEYEKTQGIVRRAQKVLEQSVNGKENIEAASSETERNGVEIPGMENSSTEKTNGGEQEDAEKEEEKPEDPREKLRNILQGGLLNFLVPNCELSREKKDFSESPSAVYQTDRYQTGDSGFQDISRFKTFLKSAVEKDTPVVLPEEQAAFVDYAGMHFSNVVHPKEESVLKCEMEYIIAGKDNDYENLQQVVEDMIWVRMPVNYAYLLTDSAKKQEALTLAAAICTATGTEALIEVVKYLLLGCWAYSETLVEMKLLLSGENIAYIKTSATWCTQLKNIGTGTGTHVEAGLDYEGMLMLLLATEKTETGYARMLDLIELNLQNKRPQFKLADCVGNLLLQGKVQVNPLFRTGGDSDAYIWQFEEEIAYQ